MCLWGTRSATLLNPLRMSRPTVRPLVDSINGWCFTNIKAASNGVLSGTGRVLHSIISYPSCEQTRHTQPRGIENTFVLYVQPTSYSVGLPVSWGRLHTRSLLCGPLEMTLFSGFSFWSFLPHGSYGSWALCPCESRLLLSPVSAVGLMFAVPSGSSL